MRYLNLLSVGILCFVLHSCANTDAEKDTATNTNTTSAPLPQEQGKTLTTVDTSIKPVNSTPNTTNNTVSVPAVQTTLPVQTTPSTSAVQTISTANTKGLNPKHGQPGHRCDIPEGAPLNSAPAQPTTAPTVQQKQPVTVTPSQPIMLNPPANTKPIQSTTVTAPGMNPEHGKPGHRCDIAVGAPLNSKPAAPTNTPVVTPASSSIPQPTPLKPDQKQN